MTGLTRLLKVSTSDGVRIKAHIRRVADKIIITVNHSELVEKDNPPFAKEGRIQLVVNKSNYQETIQMLTKYFEDLFLKGMNDESIDTGLRIGDDSRGTESKNKTGIIGVDKGKGSDTSVYPGSRRKKSTKDSGRESEPSIEVDKSSDQEIVPDGQNWS